MVQQSTSFRIGIKVDLEPPIDSEIVEPVGGDPATDAIGRFQEPNAAAGIGQQTGAGETRQAATHDHAIQRLGVTHNGLTIDWLRQ
jgi:hypothetical protein